MTLALSSRVPFRRPDPLHFQGTVFRASKICVKAIFREALKQPLVNTKEEQEENLEDLFSMVIRQGVYCYFSLSFKEGKRFESYSRKSCSLDSLSLRMEKNSNLMFVSVETGSPVTQGPESPCTSSQVITGVSHS